MLPISARSHRSGSWASGLGSQLVLSRKDRGALQRRTKAWIIPVAITFGVLFLLTREVLNLEDSGSTWVGADSTGRRGLRPAHAPFPAANLTTLVLVACHSVYTGLDYKNEDVSSWHLLDYQRGVQGQSESFLEHIRLGIEAAADDPTALLLFSGGKTRRGAGPRAEGEGYWLVAEAHDWFGKPQVKGRAFTEDKARDSFENLLFGLCRFYELTGTYPQSVAVVSYGFKRSRFVALHRAALSYPADRFFYLGTPALQEGALVGEQAVAGAFREDPYGCGEHLAAKRAARDPFNAGGYSRDRCPAMGPLLDWCGPQQYRGRLPWR